MTILSTQEEIESLGCRGLIKFKCKHCDSEFTRHKNYYLAIIKAQKSNLKTAALIHCSKKCERLARMTGKNVPCKECGKLSYKIKSDLLENPHRFCSRRCSTVFYMKIDSNRTRMKPLGSCLDCGKENPMRLLRCKECWRKNKEARLTSNSNPLVIKERRNGHHKTIRNYARENKQIMVNYKGGCCVSCGYSACLRALDFHHIDPSKKEFQISGSTRSLEKAKPELDKCILVCRNCHAEIHAGLINVNELIEMVRPEGLEPSKEFLPTA